MHMSMVMTNEALIRAVIFVGLLAVLSLAEWLKPGQRLQYSKPLRWRNNFLLLGAYTLVLRFVFPLALSGFAVYWQQFNVGLLVHIPYVWLKIVLAIILLDAIIYWQHRLMHRWPWLWHMHRIHHSDADLDVSTAVRFHPLEIFISIAVKVLAIMALGVHPVAVIIFEIMLSSFALFNHSNLRFPQQLDTVLRWFCVTPNMHRIHHSQDWQEHNTNYGFALSWWDRLFASYTAHARKGNDFCIGLPAWQKKPYHFTESERIGKLFSMRLNETPPKEHKAIG